MQGRRQAILGAGALLLESRFKRSISRRHMPSEWCMTWAFYPDRAAARRTRSTPIVGRSGTDAVAWTPSFGIFRLPGLAGVTPARPPPSTTAGTGRLALRQWPAQGRAVGRLARAGVRAG